MLKENTTLLLERMAAGIPRQAYTQEPMPEGGYRSSEFDKFLIRSLNWEMDQYETIPLWEDGAPGFDQEKDPSQVQPEMTVFGPVGPSNHRAVLVMPGGGFTNENYMVEGYPIVEAFVKKGYTTALLNYRLAPYTRYDAVQDAMRAVRQLRYRSAEWGFEPDRIAVSGGSAGGILCLALATHFDEGDPASSDPVERVSCRPDAAIVYYGAFSNTVYPASVKPGVPTVPTLQTPKQMRENLYFSPDKNLRLDMPPVFFWQGMDEDDPRGLLAITKAMADYGLRFEAHIFPFGQHAIGLADGKNFTNFNDPHVARWFDMADEWMGYYM